MARLPRDYVDRHCHRRVAPSAFERLCRGGDGRQRRPQLVGEHRQELVLATVRGFGGHACPMLELDELRALRRQRGAVVRFLRQAASRPAQRLDDAGNQDADPAEDDQRGDVVWAGDAERVGWREPIRDCRRAHQDREEAGTEPAQPRGQDDRWKEGHQAEVACEGRHEQRPEDRVDQHQSEATPVAQPGRRRPGAFDQVVDCEASDQANS